jgi:hypothetical protein
MSELHYELTPKNAIAATTQQRMFELMRSNYDFMTKDNFLADLNQKQYVGLLYDKEQTVQGFTTYAINPQNCGTSEYNILFSGDTIIAPEHWGSHELTRGFCKSVGQFMAWDIHKKWYWYLLSKGHRTYMYLPLFFEAYYPSVAPSSSDNLLAAIADAVSQCLYPKYWQKELGILKFDTKIGQLTPKLAEATFQKAKKQHVAFFLKKNPQFYEGEELVCITDLNPNNAKGFAKEIIVNAMKLNSLLCE